MYYRFYVGLCFFVNVFVISNALFATWFAVTLSLSFTMTWKQ